jgi:putative glutathione S-transferase
MDGRWVTDQVWPTDADGHFVRKASQFREKLGPGPSGETGRFPLQPGRYHLYLAHACPWCHRTAIVRELLGLQSFLSVSFVEPLMLEQGWTFGPSTPDPLYGSSAVHELYTRADPTYSGRATVPVLWDKQTHTMVNNESADIVRMLDEQLGEGQLRPPALAEEIDALAAVLYEHVNNGVYRCGFAQTQSAYEAAFHSLFSTLDQLEARLTDKQWLVGDQLTEADLRLFPTLVRFDAVYHYHFKCNRDRIAEMPALQAYLRRLYALAAFRDTTRMDEIKLHYYGSHRSINPTGIVPRGPRLALS